jgi:hypothetical protein
LASTGLEALLFSSFFCLVTYFFCSLEFLSFLADDLLVPVDGLEVVPFSFFSYLWPF